MESLRDKYEVVIGLEVHAQLKTKSKIIISLSNNNMKSNLKRLPTIGIRL